MRTALLVLLSLSLAASTALAQSRSVYVEDLTWPEIRDAIGAGRKAPAALKTTVG